MFERGKEVRPGTTLPFTGRTCALAGGIVACLFLLAATPAPAQDRSCSPPRAMREGWNASFVAGCVDRNGRFAGGSQVMHLVAHKGRLYAATGYWMDSHNVWYGGGNSNSGWAQVLALSGPAEAWSVDLDLGPRHLRTELLKSLTFSQDGQGRPLANPETLLIAATYEPGAGGISLFVRDDASGSWTRSKVIERNLGKTGEDYSVRAAIVHRDRGTGREQLFLSIGVLGVYTAPYDPAHRGTFTWNKVPELGPTRTRILSLVEADGSLFASEGTKIFQRIDGPAPRWTVVADLSGEADSSTDRATFQSIGGIRGLTPIHGPAPGRQSLIFLWTSGKTSQACVYRLDPQADGSWARTKETCLANLIGRHLHGAPVAYALGAYNEFMPVIVPATGETVHLIGLEAFIPATRVGFGWQPLTAHNQRSRNGGFYAGAMYALRNALGGWRIGEVNGEYSVGQPELVSVYTATLSPFGGADAQTIYLGGYDCDYFPSTDTAWVYSTSVANLTRGQ